MYYHGSNRSIDSLKLPPSDRVAELTEAGSPFPFAVHLAEGKRLAKTYAIGNSQVLGSPTIHEVMVNIPKSRILDIRDQVAGLTPDVIARLTKAAPDVNWGRVNKQVRPDGTAMNFLNRLPVTPEILKKAGYDAIRYSDEDPNGVVAPALAVLDPSNTKVVSKRALDIKKNRR